MSATLTTPATCPDCRNGGLVRAILRHPDDFPAYHAQMAYRFCSCPAGDRLRNADRDHDLADCLDRGEIPCVGPVRAPRMMAGEPMGLVSDDMPGF